MMEEQTSELETLLQRAENYTKSSIDLLKLRAIDTSVKIISSITSSFIVLIAALCITTMVNFGVALWIGECLHSNYLGFFIVGGFYLLLAIIFYSFRKQLVQTPLSNAIIKQMRNDQI